MKNPFSSLSENKTHQNTEKKTKETNKILKIYQWEAFWTWLAFLHLF